MKILAIIGIGAVTFLCLFALYVLYFCFRGGLGIANKQARSIGGRLLDRTAWGMNGLACMWIVLRHRRRLWRLVELSEAGSFDENTQRFEDTGQVMTLLPGMVVRSYLFTDKPGGKLLYIRRPFEFLENDWMESMGFRRKDGLVT